MTDQLISFETAKLAKEKGFNEVCFNHYGWIQRIIGPKEDATILYNASTQSLLQKWLREKYNIHIMIKPFYNSKLKKVTYATDIVQIGELADKSTRLVVQDIYEDALEIALIAALKLLL